MTDLLLVELIAVDRFQRSLDFPFVNGHLRERGLHTRWLRLGLTAHWKTLTPLAQEEVAGQLLEALRSTGAPRVLFNLFPGELVASRLAAASPKHTLAVLAGASMPASGSWPMVAASPAALAEFCGLSPDGATGSLFDVVTPDFTWEPLNDSAAAAPSLPSLICGDECLHRRRLDRNPCFDGLDLTACVRRDGCAFCVRPGERESWRADVLTLARRQLTALAKTHPPAKRLRIRPIGAPLLSRVEGLAELLVELDFPAADFLFDARADTLVTVRPALERALHRLEGTGHELHIALIGIESFADRELARFNKGTTWRDNLAAVRTLYELEQAFPNHFGFREHGGLSLLLYSPWTTPEDLALNLAVIATGEIGGLCGKLYTSRLRLYPSLPLTALARKDDLLVAAYDDPALDTARRNFYPDELPWRFAHPQLETVSRIYLRLEETQDADPISEALTRLAASTPASADRRRLAQALVDVAIREPELREPGAMLTAAAALLTPAPPPQQRAPSAPIRPPPPSTTASTTPQASEGVRDCHVRHVAAVRAGIKPVARIEPASFPTRFERQWIEARVPFTRTWINPDGHTELFLGRDRDSVARAVAATETLRRAAPGEDHRPATSEVGSLLGYPPCCVDAYAQHAPDVRANHTWMFLLLRLAAPEEVSPLTNPCAQLFEHVPCALTCAATLDIGGRMLAALAEVLEPEPLTKLRDSLGHAKLMLVDAQDQAVELLLEGDPVGRCRYRAGTRRGDAPLLDRVSEGDELVIEEQQLLVLRHGRLHAALGGRAFIWWNQAMVQRDFWQALADVKRCATRDAPQPVRSADDPDFAPPPPVPPHLREDRLAELISAALGQSPVDLGGFQVRAVRQAHYHRVSVVLGRHDETLRLLVAPSSQAPQALLREGAIAVMTERGESVDTPARIDAVRALTRTLGQRLRKEQLV